MNRRDSRICALTLIFQKSFRDDESVGEVLKTYTEDANEKTDEYAEKTYLGVFDKLDVIDEQIKNNLQNWTFDRLSKISVAIMRLSAYEIIFTDIPASISINEAVELAKKFDDSKASSFINAVLGKIAAQNGKV